MVETSGGLLFHGIPVAGMTPNILNKFLGDKIRLLNWRKMNFDEELAIIQPKPALKFEGKLRSLSPIERLIFLLCDSA